MHYFCIKLLFIIYVLVYRSDPASCTIDDHTRDYICINCFNQDLSKMNLLKSKISYTRTVKGVKIISYRYFNKNRLQNTIKNGQQVQWQILAYSESKGALFCYPCLLFGCKSSFVTTGFSNWQKAEEKITAHSNSQMHRCNIIKMNQRGVI